VAPTLQVYVFAPFALKVAELPRHIVFEEALAVMMGVGLTITHAVVNEVQVPLDPAKV
jgi:hypothetical protein